LVAAAAVESLAENLGDSVVAPLCYYAIGGLPGAVAYRAVNTLDSMIGYRGRYEWLGKAGARLDDVLNLLPSRLAVLLIVGAAAVVGEDARGAWRVARRDARLTAGPNAGWPMAAMAGALGVELEKVGHYRLGAGGAAADATAIERADRVIAVAALAAAVLACGVRAFVARRGRRWAN
jgi:adenosylcobinamide-phosphate synthase